MKKGNMQSGFACRAGHIPNSPNDSHQRMEIRRGDTKYKTVIWEQAAG